MVYSTERCSIVVPEYEKVRYDYLTGNLQIDVKQLFKDIANYVEKTIEIEIKDINHSLQVLYNLMQDACLCLDRMDEL